MGRWSGAATTRRGRARTRSAACRDHHDDHGDDDEDKDDGDDNDGWP